MARDYNGSSDKQEDHVSRMWSLGMKTSKQRRRDLKIKKSLGFACVTLTVSSHYLSMNFANFFHFFSEARKKILNLKTVERDSPTQALAGVGGEMKADWRSDCELIRTTETVLESLAQRRPHQKSSKCFSRKVFVCIIQQARVIFNAEKILGEDKNKCEGSLK